MLRDGFYASAALSNSLVLKKQHDQIIAARAACRLDKTFGLEVAWLLMALSRPPSHN